MTKRPQRRLAGAAPLGLALLFASPAASQLPSITGCYDLEIGEWSPSVEIGGDSLYTRPPPRILLDTLSDTGMPGRPGYTLREAPGALPSIHRFSSWRPLGADSVELIWTNGFSGLRVAFAHASRPLRGEARTFWDFGRETQRAPAIAMPVACDSPLPEELAARFRFPRGIAMAGADSILIGEPLNRAGLDVVQQSIRGLLIRSPAAAPFADASELRVVVSADDVVEQIRVSFPAGSSHEQIVARLVEHYGEPTSQNQMDLPSGRVSRMTMWSSRMIGISVMGGDGSTVGVMFRDPRGE